MQPPGAWAGRGPAESGGAVMGRETSGGIPRTAQKAEPVQGLPEITGDGGSIKELKGKTGRIVTLGGINVNAKRGLISGPVWSEFWTIL